MKRCSLCRRYKQHQEFNKNRAAKDGYQNWCRACYHSAMKSKSQRTLTEEERTKIRYVNRWYRIRRLYGIDEEQWLAMRRKQGGRCAGCGKKCKDDGPIGAPDVFHVDHCHNSDVHQHTNGEVRGLLCHPCNHALALMRDDPKVARRLARYLTRAGCVT